MKLLSSVYNSELRRIFRKKIYLFLSFNFIESFPQTIYIIRNTNPSNAVFSTGFKRITVVPDEEIPSLENNLNSFP